VLDQADSALRTILSRSDFTRVLRDYKGLVSAVAFSPDGSSLATVGCATPVRNGACESGEVRLWALDRLDAAPIVLRGHEDWVGSVVFSKDGRTLATGSWDGTMRLWDLERLGAAPIVLRAHEDRVNALALDPDGRSLVTGSRDATARVWIMRTETLPS
jgi:WD40 repeat protein